MGAPRARAQCLPEQGAPLSGWGGGRCKQRGPRSSSKGIGAASRRQVGSRAAGRRARGPLAEGGAEGL